GGAWAGGGGGGVGGGLGLSGVGGGGAGGGGRARLSARSRCRSWEILVAKWCASRIISIILDVLSTATTTMGGSNEAWLTQLAVMPCSSPSRFTVSAYRPYVKCRRTVCLAATFMGREYDTIFVPWRRALNPGPGPP